WKAGALYPYHFNTPVGNGGVVVAQWADGLPCVIRGNINGHTVVELNFFGGPSSFSANYGWDTATDGGQLLTNALNFVIPLLRFTTAKQVDFGALPVFTPSTSQTVTYTNVSSSPQTITSIGISGGNLGDFSLTPGGALPATIQPAGT